MEKAFLIEQMYREFGKGEPNRNNRRLLIDMEGGCPFEDPHRITQYIPDVPPPDSVKVPFSLEANDDMTRIQQTYRNRRQVQRVKKFSDVLHGRPTPGELPY